MAAKLTRLAHKIAIKLYLVAERCTTCSFVEIIVRDRDVSYVSGTPSHCDRIKALPLVLFLVIFRSVDAFHFHITEFFQCIMEHIGFVSF
jgi:hypothetical protein